MNLSCDECKKKHKGSYSSFFFEGKILTLCDECRYGKRIPRNMDSNDKLFNKLQTPYWKLMGLKPTAKEKAYEANLKRRGMTFGDAVRERDYYRAKHPSAIGQFNQHIKQYGTKNAPDTSFNKDR